MKRSFDAIVIGAGVVGLSAAYQLSARGLDTLVIEKGFPGAGSHFPPSPPKEKFLK